MQEKMKISAVICEINPLHRGHQALFAHARKGGRTLMCVLSGNFVQRGELALMDKWARARLALAAGADLVVELPLPWALAGAERFAAGGVALAAALGGADTLVFGSEEPRAPRLWEVARTLLSPEFPQALEATDGALPFARRRQNAVAALLGEERAALLEEPNCILGIEYMKAILTQGAPLEVQVFPRRGAGHDVPEEEGPIYSARQARELLREGADLSGRLPQGTLNLWRELSEQGRAPASLEKLESAAMWRLRTMELEDFAALPDVSEGLENRMYRASRQASNLGEWMVLTMSKRYPAARVRRLMLNALLGVRAGGPALPPYLRVLAMTSAGEQALRQSSPTLPVAVRAGDFSKLGKEARGVFQLEARADDLYDLAVPRPAPCGRDYTQRLLKADRKRKQP